MMRDKSRGRTENIVNIRAYRFSLSATGGESTRAGFYVSRPSRDHESAIYRADDRLASVMVRVQVFSMMSRRLDSKATPTNLAAATSPRYVGLHAK